MRKLLAATICAVFALTLAAGDAMARGGRGGHGGSHKSHRSTSSSVWSDSGTSRTAKSKSPKKSRAKSIGGGTFRTQEGDSPASAEQRPQNMPTAGQGQIQQQDNAALREACRQIPTGGALPAACAQLR